MTTRSISLKVSFVFFWLFGYSFAPAASLPSDSEIEKIIRDSLVELARPQYMCSPRTIRFQKLEILKRGRPQDEGYPLQVQVDFTCEQQHNIGRPVGNKWVADVWIKRNQYDEWSIKTEGQGKFSYFQIPRQQDIGNMSPESIRSTRKNLALWTELRKQHKFDMLPALDGEDRNAADFVLRAARTMMENDPKTVAKSFVCPGKLTSEKTHIEEMETVVEQFQFLRSSSAVNPKLTDLSPGKAEIEVAGARSTYDAIIEYSASQMSKGKRVPTVESAGMQVFRLNAQNSTSSGSPYCLASMHGTR